MPEVGQPVDIEVWSAFMPAGHGAWLMPVLERIFIRQAAAESCSPGLAHRPKLVAQSVRMRALRMVLSSTFFSCSR